MSESVSQSVSRVSEAFTTFRQLYLELFLSRFLYRPNSTNRGHTDSAADGNLFYPDPRGIYIYESK